jgi:hypothetical protein
VVEEDAKYKSAPVVRRLPSASWKPGPEALTVIDLVGSLRFVTVTKTCPPKIPPVNGPLGGKLETLVGFPFCVTLMSIGNAQLPVEGVAPAAGVKTDADAASTQTRPNSTASFFIDSLR